jgi:hypothetical protein
MMKDFHVIGYLFSGPYLQQLQRVGCKNKRNKDAISLVKYHYGL